MKRGIRRREKADDTATDATSTPEADVTDIPAPQTDDSDDDPYAVAPDFTEPDDEPEAVKPSKPAADKPEKPAEEIKMTIITAQEDEKAKGKIHPTLCDAMDCSWPGSSAH